MKFCEKLQKLRKEKGYSQEELADLLEVSRQSVSKWESGTTYPEMDKLLSLCKIFGVSLDDLTNDEVSTEKIKEKNQNSFSNLIYTLMEMISKSIEMFKHMGRRNVLKCLMEMFILIVILAVFYLPFEIINNSISDILINFPSNTFSVLMSIWMFISNTIYLVLVIAIFIYVYKTRYLDKFNLDEIKEVKKESIDEISAEKVTEEKIVKEKSTRQSFVVFDILGAIFNFFVKMFLFFMTIPTIFVFIAFVIIAALALIIQFMGIHYIGIFVTFLGFSTVCFVVMEIFIRLLFSNAIKFKKAFITFVIGLIVSGVGIAWIVVEAANTKYIDTIPDGIIEEVYESTFKMQDDLIVAPYIYDASENDNLVHIPNIYLTKYEVDESLKDDIKVVMNYYKDYQTVGAGVHNNYLVFNEYTNFDNFKNIWSLVKTDLQNKVVHKYDELYQVEITIVSSSKNIEKLKENRKKRDQDIEKENERYNYYETRIDELTKDLYDKDERIDELQEKVDELQDKLNNIKNEFR